MMPALFFRVAGMIGVRSVEQREELVGVLGHPAADDDEVGPEEVLEVAGSRPAAAWPTPRS